jgi:hypothetical protein
MNDPARGCYLARSQVEGAVAPSGPRAKCGAGLSRLLGEVDWKPLLRRGS